MITAYFDIVQFMDALDRVREERGLAWSAVFRQTAVYGITSAQTRRRWCKRGETHRAMSIHTMATLASWAGLDVQQFIKQEVKSAR